MVEPAEDLGPGRPGHQLPRVGEHLVGLVGVGDHLTTEWSTLIGPDLSRYCSLIGSEVHAITTQLKPSIIPTIGGIFWFSLCCYGMIGVSGPCTERI